MQEYENCGRRMRNSNLEIIRIISMIFIVTHHYSVYGFEINSLGYSLNRYVVGVLSLGGKFGVNCFVLISGYFMVSSKITVRKLVQLIAEAWFYSMGMVLLFLFVLEPVNPIGIKNVIKACIPLIYSTYWFIEAYIILMIIAPVLNLAISQISQSTHQKIIILSVLIWYVIPSFTLADYGWPTIGGCFVILYFIAAYIRKYVSLEQGNAIRHFAVGIALYAVIIVSDVVLIWLGHLMKMPFLTNHSSHLAGLTSPLCLFAAVELLLGFLKLKPYSNVWINYLASASLGVYLIHENPIMRPYLWQNILNTANMYESPLLALHAVVSVAGVYLVCSVIDLIRQATVERVFQAVMERYYGTVRRKALRLANRLAEKGGQAARRIHGG